MLGEKVSDEMRQAARPGLVEDRLEVLLHGQRANSEAVGNLDRGQPLQHQLRNLDLALSQAIGLEHERCNLRWCRWLQDHRDRAAAGSGREPGRMEYQP